MLQCEHCTGLQALHHRMTMNDVEAGVSKGCTGCSLLGQAIGCFKDLKKSVAHITWSVDRTMQVTLLSDKRQSIATLEIFTDPGTDGVLETIGPARRVSKGGWTEEHISLAKEWLRTCSKDHDICPSLKPQPLPTRVIDVGSDDQSLRLHISEGECAEYVALSHCWGGHRATVTSKATLEEHGRVIPLNASSQTFIDAARVCRDLDIKYLWIDSLCIVQDDIDDWAAEAGRMSQVYHNATLTISAEGAQNAKKGLFSEKVGSCSLRQTNFQTIWPSGNLGKVNVRIRNSAQKTQGGVDNFAHAGSLISKSELSERAWVLQERLLSPRILHFYKEELAWSCASVSRCECRLDAGLTDINIFKKMKGSGVPIEVLRKEFHQEWTRLVEEFTHRKLTYIKDRLAAMSGLARLCSEVTLDKYCAGLFEKDLAYGILWISDHHASSEVIKRNHESSPLPTWSWASTSGPVKYLDRHRSQFERRSRGATVEPILKILGVTMKPKGQNPFGDVGAGLLTVKGQLLRVCPDHSGRKLRPWDDEVAAKLESQQYSITSENRRKLEEMRESSRAMFEEMGLTFDGPVVSAPSGPTSKPPVIIPDFFGPGGELHRDNTYLLRVGKYIFDGSWSSQASENVCILLVKATGPLLGDLPFYRRYGIVLHAFPSDLVWLETNAPTKVLGIL